MKETVIKLAMNAVDLLNDEYKKSGYTSIARTKVEEYVTNRAKFLQVSEEDVATILNHIDVIIQCKW